MIDVMMFLLVFFVLISVNVIPALGLKTKLPLSSQAKEERPPVRAIVTLTKDGQILVDGAPVKGQAELADALRRQREKKGSALSVVIRGDEAVPLQRLVDVMDTLKSTGIESMTISAQKK